jgi:hypothetical protein
MIVAQGPAEVVLYMSVIRADLLVLTISSAEKSRAFDTAFDTLSFSETGFCLDRFEEPHTDNVCIH